MVTSGKLLLARWTYLSPVPVFLSIYFRMHWPAWNPNKPRQTERIRLNWHIFSFLKGSPSSGKSFWVLMTIFWGFLGTFGLASGMPWFTWFLRKLCTLIRCTMVRLHSCSHSNGYTTVNDMHDAWNVVYVIFADNQYSHFLPLRRNWQISRMFWTDLMTNISSCRGVLNSHLPFAHVNAIRLIMYYRTSQVQNDWRKYQEDEELSPNWNCSIHVLNFTLLNSINRLFKRAGRCL